jgi:hypothetical protein
LAGADATQCGDEAFIYAQMPCLIEETAAQARRLFGLLAGCIAVFIYLFTVVYYDYIKSVQMNTYVDWDVKTITAGDYTLEFDIDEETYAHWKKNYYDERNPISENAQFKLYVQNQLEARISAMPHLGIDNNLPVDQNGNQIIKVAQITFAYRNAEIVNWLQKRGTLIKTEKWQKVQELNNTILDNIKNKEGLLDRL